MPKRVCQTDRQTEGQKSYSYSSISVNAYRQTGSDSALARVGSSLRTLPSDAVRFRRFFRVRISIVYVNKVPFLVFSPNSIAGLLNTV